MSWNRRYALRSYLQSAIWIVPLIALVLEQISIRLAYALHIEFGWMPKFEIGVAGAQSAMDTIVSITASFIVFTFGSLLVAIQVASSQLTPRIIATTLLRDNVIRFTVGLFIFTLLFASGTKVRMDATVPHTVVVVVALLGLGSVVAFLHLIDYAARLLRPVAIVWRIGERGLKVIDSVYPKPIENPYVPAPARQKLGPPERTVLHRGNSAIVLAVNLKALVAAARKADGVIEFAPHVGDFVAVGDPLFLLRGGAVAIDDRMLRGQVAFGPERTIEQDSTFAFRIIVDIAIKALSKAINDPTTAILAIDQLHRLLRTVGKRHLHDEAISDGAGRLRLIFHTPNWEDFVQLTFSEIRLYGAENFQIARRLRAMIENLMQSLPEFRRPALRRELDLLDRTLEKLYPFPEDLALARVPDLQGLGGASGAR